MTSRAIFVAAFTCVLLAAVPARAAVSCEELWGAAMADDVAAIARLINAGEKVDCRDPVTAETPLMAAASSGFVDSVKLLLLVGADPNIRSVKGQTALDMARAREAAFATQPGFSALTERMRQVIAALTPVTSGPLQPVTPVTIVPTDADAVARMKLEGARAALTVRDYDGAGKAILEVMRMAGVVGQRRAQAFTLACDVGMRTKDWELAKTMCEKALSIEEVSDDDRVWSTATLKALRKQFPELFK